MVDAYSITRWMWYLDNGWGLYVQEKQWIEKKEIQDKIWLTGKNNTKMEFSGGYNV